MFLVTCLKKLEERRPYNVLGDIACLTMFRWHCLKKPGEPLCHCLKTEERRRRNASRLFRITKQSVLAILSGDKISVTVISADKVISSADKVISSRDADKVIS